MNVCLWHSPFNGGWVWLDRRNLKRCSFGRDGKKIWWAIFGLSGSIILQSWPWQRSPSGR